MSLRHRLVLMMTLAALSGVVAHAALTQWPLPQALAWLRVSLGLGPAWSAPAPGGAWAIVLTAAIVLPFCVWSARAVLAPLARLLQIGRAHV